jgi:hypothetical protein
VKPQKLIELLKQLPADCDVKANAVGNLMVLGTSGLYLGWIDFTYATLEVKYVQIDTIPEPQRAQFLASLRGKQMPVAEGDGPCAYWADWLKFSSGECTG